MDMGIITIFKRLCQRQLIKSVTARGDLSLPEFPKRLTVKEACACTCLTKAPVKRSPGKASMAVGPGP
ncbi:hypothetical protein DPMN_116318 [Dreissena polymorpha]|uniref:Uncharacterized protein n=1 Tax=Dreissena polymorpha TaxID=45954 RepID=A0A9D4KNM8_DREPO|nr:hypothetical protein DPMN_116318 [Dreissena polymorpha]